MRSFLYSKECPQGRIFKDEEEFNAAKKEGWVEAPWEIGEKKKAAPEKKEEPEKKDKAPGGAKSSEDSDSGEGKKDKE